MTDTKDWQGTTHGSKWLLKSLIAWLRHSSLYLPYGCMSVIVLFYMLFNHKGYIASYHLYHDRLKMKPLKAFCYVYLNHFRFGQVIIDRFAMYAGHKFQIDIDHPELFDELETQAGGFMQLSAHVGNFELAGYSLTPRNKRIYVLVFGGEKEIVMQSREEIMSGHHISLVPVSPDLSHIFTLNSALQTGNIVSMTADRLFGSSRSITCDFLGAKAKFPIGSFSLATQREIPVLTVFVVKTGTKSYRIHLHRLAEATKEALAKSYVNILEETVRQYPTQWFNFYKFWM